jgi:hypothetical protein
VVSSAAPAPGPAASGAPARDAVSAARPSALLRGHGFDLEVAHDAAAAPPALVISGSVLSEDLRGFDVWRSAPADDDGAAAAEVAVGGALRRAVPPDASQRPALRITEAHQLVALRVFLCGALAAAAYTPD